MKDQNPNWPKNPDYLYIILIIEASGSGKTNSFFNRINLQPDFVKFYLYVKDPYGAKNQFLIKKGNDAGKKCFNDSKAFIVYSNNMNDIYKNIEDYKSNKKKKLLVVFHDMIADMLSNKKLNPIVTELSISGRKRNTCMVFIIQSYSVVPKNIRLNSTDYFIMKI